MAATEKAGAVVVTSLPKGNIDGDKSDEGNWVVFIAALALASTLGRPAIADIRCDCGFLLRNLFPLPN